MNITQTSPFTGRVFDREIPARLTAAPPIAKQNDSLAMVQDANPGLARYLRPQSAFQWWTLPYLAAITPQYIQTILIGAMSGNHVPAWQLFDLMIDTNPEIGACIGEYVDGILEKNLIIEPYHEEDEQPSQNAIRNQKIVAAALRNMRPDPANDENAIEGTIRDILFGRFHGQSVLESDWFDTFGTGAINTLTVPGIGDIAAPRATFWVHPVCYAYDVTGRIGLRLPPELIKQQSKAAKGFKPGAALDVGTGAAMPWSGFTGPSRPDAITNFPRNQFLISIFKSKTGSALSGSCLRSLAWWWCVSNFAGDWLLDLAQIFGIPFRKAKYQQGVGEPQKAEAREMLQNMGSRGWCLLDERVDVEFEKAIESGAQSPQGFLIELAERQFRKVILRQTMTGSHGTTGKGGGQAFGETEKDVKSQCLNAGAKFACSVLREQLARHVLLNNLNDDSELPFISLSDDDQGGLVEAQTIQALQTAGAGKAIPLNWINRRFNIPQPSDGEETLADAQPAAAPLANEPGSAAVPAASGKPKPGDKKPSEAAQLEAVEKAESGKAESGNAPTEAYQEKALQQYSKAFSEDVQHVLVRLAAILEIKDDAIFKSKLDQFLTDFPSLKKDVLTDPAAARALQPIIATALANGLASKTQNPKSEVLQAGDVGGHEFHGNQYTEAIGQIQDVLAGKKDEAAYATVSPDTAAKIKEATGRDVTGYKHFIDHDALVHIDKQHGVGKEDQENHEPVTKDDIEKIPQIVASPDQVMHGGKSARGLSTVKYSKRFNGTTYYVEEEWSKEKVLAAKTMYKIKTPGNSATPEGGVSHTSKTSGANEK